MTVPVNTLSPQVQLIFFKGYQQALEDLTDQITDRACQIELEIDNLQALVAAKSKDQAVIHDNP